MGSAGGLGARLLIASLVIIVGETSVTAFERLVELGEREEGPADP
jgi:hypothetical protein